MSLNLLQNCYYPPHFKMYFYEPIHSKSGKIHSWKDSNVLIGIY